MCRFASLIALLALPLTATAQPAFFEPPRDYYKARGAKVSVTWSVDRTTLPEDAVLTATLTIEGAENPQEVVRPDLSKIPLFADRFLIEDASGHSPKFVYRLRPRNASVSRLPTLDFWYDSGVKVGNPFKKTTAKGIDLVVTKVENTRPPAVPLIEPEKLFSIESGPRALQSEPFTPGAFLWILLFVLGAVVACLWYVLWRRMYPDGARLAQLRRNRALRRATDAIRKADRSADPAAALSAAVVGYLRSRFPLPIGAETPGEVEESLRTAGSAEADRIAGFLRRCDEARFSPPGDTPLALAVEARAVLARLEAAE